MTFRKSGSFKKSLISGARLKIKIFQMQLANQNLLQYSDLDGLQDFNQYINRNIFMIFGNKNAS